MKKKPATPIFSISIKEFYTFLMTILGFIKRDKAEFAKHGVTDAKITEVETMLTEFSEIPTDDELLGTQMIATDNKEKARFKLHDSISEVIDRAASKYGHDSGYYRRFGVFGLAALDGGILSTAARRVFRIGTSMASDLAGEGLTPVMLDNLKNDNEVFDTALETQADAVSDREIATENRIEKANTIYLIMSNYCDKGKRIWESVNQAKYNDYVIYDTPSGKQEGAAPAKA